MTEALALLLPVSIFLGCGVGLLLRSTYAAACTVWLVLAGELGESS